MTALLLAALVLVESGGNVRAVGDGGLAVGPLQIHETTVFDVNRIAGTRFILGDRTDRAKSEAMARIYLGHYVTRERLGHEPCPADYARVWNGGPTGHQKAATAPYWRKVERAMKSVSSGQQSAD